MSRARLKQILTAKDTDSDEYRIRKRIEKRINSRVRTGMELGAKDADRYLAVDIAWDGETISKDVVPLLLFAQGKIDQTSLVNRLDRLGCADKYIEEEKVEGGEPIKKLSVPRLYETSINLVRSLLMRRIAAQSARYSNLWPYFKYESRSKTMENRARASILSARVDIMADQYGYRRLFVQAIRDMFLYGHVVLFPSCSWDVVKESRVKQVRGEYEGEPELEKVVVREGVDFLNPHPTRVYWDVSQPLSKLNTDTGPDYIGFWDIARYGSLKDDPGYFNRDKLLYSSWFPELITKYPNLFGYCFEPTVVKSVARPECGGIADTGSAAGMAQHNDRGMNVGYFSTEDRDKGISLVNHFERINPKQEGICDYDGDVWVRFVTTADETIVYAEPMPSMPAVYGGINENDSRLANPSMAHDLLGIQDQLTNILSQLLKDMKTAMTEIWMVDKDQLDAEAQKYIKEAITTEKIYQSAQAVFYSGSEARTIGLDGKANRIIERIQIEVSRKISDAFRAITELMELAERLMVLSPQELGQNSRREASASEVVEIAKSVDTIYTFISDGVDELRAGTKKLLFESLQACSSSKLKVPDEEMFQEETLQNIKMDSDNGLIIGEVSDLQHEYVYNSRDGVERTSNVEAAKVLANSLNNLLPNEDFREALGKERMFKMFAEIFRLAGISYGGEMFNLSEGELTQPVVGGDKANKLLEVVESLHARISQLEQMQQGGGEPGIVETAPEGAPPDVASSPEAAAVAAVLRGDAVQ